MTKWLLFLSFVIQGSSSKPIQRSVAANCSCLACSLSRIEQNRTKNWFKLLEVWSDQSANLRFHVPNLCHSSPDDLSFRCDFRPEPLHPASLRRSSTRHSWRNTTIHKTQKLFRGFCQNWFLLRWEKFFRFWSLNSRGLHDFFENVLSVPWLKQWVKQSSS